MAGSEFRPESRANASRRPGVTPGIWMGPVRVMMRSRAGRRAGDAGRVLTDLARGSDTAVGMSMRGRRALLVLDPELAGRLLVELAPQSAKGPGVQMTRPLLGNGLLTSEGETHNRARRLVGWAFSPRRLANYVDEFAACARRHEEGWTDGGRVDLHAEMGALTLTMVGRTLFGVDLTAATQEIRGALDDALTAFAEGGALLRRRGRRRGRRRSGMAARQSEATAPIHRFVDSVIQERRRHPGPERADVVSALVGESDDGLSDQEIHDNVMTLLMAGHETTANALTWCLYLVGRNPEVERQLHEEVDRLRGRAPTSADLPSLVVTRAVVAEALRLYPPAWIIGRTMTAAAEIGGWHVQAGTLVAVSPLLMHHDGRWFTGPEVFDPQRWLDGRQKRLPRNAFLPFGTGPRSCIGEQFAWAEAVVALAVLTGRWTARVDPDHTLAVQYAVTLRPAGGLPMTLTGRHLAWEGG